MSFSEAHFSEAHQKWYLENPSEYITDPQSLYSFLGYQQNLNKAEYLRCILCGRDPKDEWPRVRRDRFYEIYLRIRETMAQHGLIEEIERSNNLSPTRYRLIESNSQNNDDVRVWEGIDDVLYLLERAGFRRQPYHFIFKLLNSTVELEKRLENSLRDFSRETITPQFEAISNVHRIWEIAPAQPKYIQINGTVSLFGPLLSVAPDLSSKIQRRYRQQGIETFIDPENRNLRQIAVENWGHNLSFLSGQMVWYCETQNWVCLGLFQGVCKNSIPVFVRKNIFEVKLKKYFEQDNSIRTYTAQLRVRGKLVFFETSYTEELVKLYCEILSVPISKEIRQKCCFRALVVDGNDKTNIMHFADDDPMYLDGDLWCLTKRSYSESCQYLSLICKTGINISDVELTRTALIELRTEINALNRCEGQQELYGEQLYRNI